MGKTAFFEAMASQGLALTYNDVRLKTRASTVPAHEVNLETRFSRNVLLKTPIVSAAMDTITTADMAVAMAKLGGIGVIHAGLSPQQQAKEVKRVKYHLNGLIKDPITVQDDDTLQDVLDLRAARRYQFHSFPVVNASGKLVGLITRNDIELSDNTRQLVREMMTTDINSAPAATSLNQAYELMMRFKKKTLPLIDAESKVAGLYVFSDVARIKRGSSLSYNVDDEGRLRVAAAVPTDDSALERIRLMDGRVDVVVVDTARGDGIAALTTLKKIKRDFPELDVVVGNISEGSSARLLAEAGADGIKVGQGPGSICTTRVEAGIGCPQVTAVYECARAVRAFNIPICADGGVNDPGDVSIALGAGAESVMLGRLLAGTKETPGEVVMQDGNLVKSYRGMGSAAAMKESSTSRRRYGDQEGARPIPEGVESYVPYQGVVDDVMYHYLGALRKSLEYCGAGDIAEHRAKADFYRITGAGVTESRPHNVTVVTQSPAQYDI